MRPTPPRTEQAMLTPRRRRRAERRDARRRCRRSARRTGPRRARRYFAAVNDGQVITSCESARDYRYVVLPTGLNGTFATFHVDFAGACRAQAKCWVDSAPTKQIVTPLVTTTPLRPGTRWVH